MVGGSNAKLRRLCSASRVEETKVPRDTSIWADTGTALHHIVEWALRGDHTDDEVLKEWTGVPVKIDDMAYTVDITPEHLHDKVLPALEFVDNLGEDMTVYVERKVSFRRANAHTVQGFEEIEGAFGTADLLFYDDTRAGGLDNKFGDGRIVKADDNDQCRFYLCGAIMNGLLPIRDEYEFWIFQPAASLDPSEYASKGVYTLDDLIAFNGDLAAAILEEPKHNPGSHCADCKGKMVCPAYQKFLAGVIPSDVEGMSTRDLAQALEMVSSVRKWADEVERAALRNAETGHPVPGWGLMPAEGRTDWRDDRAAWNALGRLGIDAKARTVSKTVSPAQALKLLKKAGVEDKQRDRFMTTHSFRPDRGQKLVKLKEHEKTVDTMQAMAEQMRARGL